MARSLVALVNSLYLLGLQARLPIPSRHRLELITYIVRCLLGNQGALERVSLYVINLPCGGEKIQTLIFVPFTLQLDGVGTRAPSLHPVVAESTVGFDG